MADRQDGPTGKCRVVSAMSTREHSFAVYAKIVVEDEAGRRWSFEASSFNFSLKPEDGGPKEAM